MSGAQTATAKKSKPENENAPQAPPGATRVKDTLSVLTTALPIIGAVGTLFVWMTANFYVGDVNIKVPSAYNNLSVKVYDPRGQEGTYHSPNFKLMPNTYHLVITVDENKPQHADTTVTFGNVSVVEVAPPAQNDSPEASTEPGKKKRWWQIWRKQEQ